MTAEELIARYAAGETVILAKELKTHPATIRVMVANLRKMGYLIPKPPKLSTRSLSEAIRHRAYMRAYRSEKNLG